VTTRVIALSGWKGSGKDTVAEYLVAKHGFTRFALADLLKDMTSAMFHIDRKHLDDRLHKEAALLEFPVSRNDADSRAIQAVVARELDAGYWTPRAMAIVVGALARSVDPHYWTRRLCHLIIQSHSPRVVITDVRFVDELEFFQKVFRTGLTTARVIRDIEVDSVSASESNLDDYPFSIQIRNTGTIKELHMEVESWLIPGLQGLPM
jgi:hypothetical protein